MKTIKYILIAIACLLSLSMCGQQNEFTLEAGNTYSLGNEPIYLEYLEIKKPTKKELQYEFTASTIYLMDLYMEETKNDSIEVYVVDKNGNGKMKWLYTTKPKSFEDFYNWTQKYFKNEKDSISIVIE